MPDTLDQQLTQPPKVPVKRVRPFNDIAKGLDPMMPQEQYEGLRATYFNTYVAPHYKNDADKQAGQVKFNQLTERKPLLTTGEKIKLAATLPATEFFKKAEESKLIGGVAKFVAGSKTFDEQLTKDTSSITQMQKLAAREGMTRTAGVAQAVGDLGEMGVEVASLENPTKAVSALTEGLGLLKAGTFTAKSLALKNRMLLGGTTFGLYESMHDEKGLAHSFIDGKFETGAVQGALFEWANVGSRLRRVIKGAGVGGVIGASGEDDSRKQSGFLTGALLGGAFGLLPGEPHTKDEDIQRALTPGVTKPLIPEVDNALAKSVVDSTQKAKRELKTPEVNIDESLRGVRVRMTDAQGHALEIPVAAYAEGRALQQMQDVTMSGGKLEGIDYSTTHGDIANRLIKLQKASSVSAESVDRKILVESKQPTPPKIPTTPLGPVLDGYYAQLDNAVRDLGNSNPNIVKAAKATLGNRGTASLLKEYMVWGTNHAGSTPVERKFLLDNLTHLYNNRGVAKLVDVNANLKALAHKPELRELLPPQFREVFDSAVLQSPKDASFLKDMFQYKTEYNQLKPISPNRTDSELVEMSGILNKIKQGKSSGNQGYGGGETAYWAAYNNSFKYPEIGASLSPEQRVAWDAARKESQRQETKAREEADMKKVIPAENIATVNKVATRINANPKPGGFFEKWTREAELNDILESLPDIHNTPINEIDEVMKDEIEKKSRGISNPGVAEEFIRTGQWERGDYSKKVFAATTKIPPGEARTTLEMGDNAKIEDGVLKVYVPQHVLDKHDAGAFYQPNQVLEVLDDLGFRDHPDEVIDYVLQGNRWIDPMNGNLLAGYGNGMVVLPYDNPAEHEFHELMHHGMDFVSGLTGFHPEQFGLSSAASKTIDQIGEALKGISTYERSPKGDLNEEAFVHAATAVMKEDKQSLYGMGLVDTSVNHVVNMVYDMSAKALTKLQQRPDWVEKRYIQDRFRYTREAASPMTSYPLRTAADRLGMDFYAGEDGSFRIADGSDTKVFRDKSQAFAHMLRFDNTAEAPSWTMPLEQIGILTDSPTLAKFAPSRTGVTLEPSPEAKGWQGRMALTSLTRPTGPWVAKAQGMLDKSWAGTQHIPLLDAFKKVDEAFMSSSGWIEDQRELFAKDLKHFESEKLYDVFNFLSKEERFWPGMAAKYNMSPEDMTHVSNLYKNLRSLSDTQHIGVFNYFLRELPLLQRNGWKTEGVFHPLKDPKEASTFYRGILEGRFKPQDTHAGRFINYVLKASQDKVLEKPIADLKAIVNLKDKAGDYILGSLRAPMERYINYMTNKPDASQKLINSAVAGFQTGIYNQFAKINKHLPDKLKLPTEAEYPGAAINKLMSLSYVSGLGLRAAVPIRDALQVVTNALPIIGMKNFSKGTQLALNAEGWEIAEKDGALLHRGNVGELYGDIFNEIPIGGSGKLDKAVELSNKLLAPSRWGHNIGRAITYHGTLDTAQKSIQGLRAGRVTPDKFIADTGIWFLEKPERSRYLAMASDRTNESREVAKKIALDMVDRTLWAYRRGQQPGVLRTGAGRVFGQYGMWPLNYGEYLRTLGTRALEGGSISKSAVKAAATFLGVSLAAYDVLDDHMGVDAGKWMFLSPAGYAGGPNLEFVQALMKSPEDSDDGRKARKTVMEYPLNFVPAANQTRSVLETINDPKYWNDFDNTPTDAGWLKLAGFRPIDEKEEERESNWTIDQKLRHGAGLNQGKGDLLGNPE